MNTPLGYLIKNEVCSFAVKVVNVLAKLSFGFEAVNPPAITPVTTIKDITIPIIYIKFILFIFPLSIILIIFLIQGAG